MALPLALALAAAGCQTVAAQRRMEAARAVSDAERLAAEVARLKERQEALTVNQQELYRQLEELRAAFRDEQAKTAENVAAIERTLKALEDAQQGGRQEIIDALSKKLADMLKALPKPAAPRVESGYEHVVGPGETLSAIAAAYKVKPQDIIKANNLQNPNALRVGQKLFIPE